jgi:hypothetical protein
VPWPLFGKELCPRFQAARVPVALHGDWQGVLAMHDLIAYKYNHGMAKSALSL